MYPQEFFEVSGFDYEDLINADNNNNNNNNGIFHFWLTYYTD